MSKGKDLDAKTLGVVASVIFAILSIGGFFYLWTAAKNYSVDLAVSEKLKTVEVETVKKDAENILENLEKVSDMPIPTPLGKMGKTNPFTSS